jgi:dephospho-CoA kinase
MSGSGKSSVIQELAIRGYKAIDTDWHPRWEHVSGEARPGILESDWMWREDAIQDLLDTEDAGIVFVSACVPNQGKFYDQLDHIVLLTAPEAVTVERLAHRTNNPYGKLPEEVADVLHYRQTVEPMLRRNATHVIDTSIPLVEVVLEILAITAPPTGAGPVG